MLLVNYKLSCFYTVGTIVYYIISLYCKYNEYDIPLHLSETVFIDFEEVTLF